jgi:hypothetical protein
MGKLVEIQMSAQKSGTRSPILFISTAFNFRCFWEKNHEKGPRQSWA